MRAKPANEKRALVVLSVKFGLRIPPTRRHSALRHVVARRPHALGCSRAVTAGRPLASAGGRPTRSAPPWPLGCEGPRLSGGAGSWSAHLVRGLARTGAATSAPRAERALQRRVINGRPATQLQRPAITAHAPRATCGRGVWRHHSHGARCPWWFAGASASASAPSADREHDRMPTADRPARIGAMPRCGVCTGAGCASRGTHGHGSTSFAAGCSPRMRAR